MSGLTIDTQNAIKAKAKIKNDGCYKFRGVAYRVRSGHVTHLVCGGEVLQPFGYFNVSLGKLESYSTDAALKYLKGVRE